MIPAAAAGKIRALRGGCLVLVATPAAAPAIRGYFRTKETLPYVDCRVLAEVLNQKCDAGVRNSLGVGHRSGVIGLKMVDGVALLASVLHAGADMQTEQQEIVLAVRLRVQRSDRKYRTVGAPRRAWLLGGIGYV